MPIFFSYALGTFSKIPYYPANHQQQQYQQQQQQHHQ